MMVFIDKEVAVAAVYVVIRLIIMILVREKGITPMINSVFDAAIIVKQVVEEVRKLATMNY
jgi:hypothetical protein